MSLRIEGLIRHALTRRVLERITLEVRDGECLALLGAPGSGRASLLRSIAGLEEPDAGRILLDGRDITRLPPRRRGIAYLFQQDALIGHPTVYDAVAAALPVDLLECTDAPDGTPAAEAGPARVRHLLSLVGLSKDEGWMPAMLPPGKRHRLMAARAIAAQPRVLLVGETFGVEGAPSQPRRWLRELHAKLGLTTVLVAQGAAEALALGDRIAVLGAGRLEQHATPAELLRRPASGVVAQALGQVLPMSGTDAAPLRGLDRAWAGASLPAEALEVVEPASGSPARVMSSTAFGATLRLELEMLGDGRRVEAEVPSLGMATMLPPGSIVGLRMRRPL
jgi:sulfate/thiosulfate transport system ATP-binding protein